MRPISTKAILLLVFAWLGGSIQAQSEFKLPAYEKVKLKNGLTVYLMEQHEVPLIYGTMNFKAGAIYDGDKAGLAAMTAEALKFGTSSYTKAEIEETFDFLGASLSLNAGKEKSAISFSCGSRDRDKVMGVIKELLTSPSFTEDEFSKRKQRWVGELKTAKESPRSVIDFYWNSFIYNNHGYANPTIGTQTGIAALKRGDVESFYKKYYHPRNAALALVGDFDSKEMKKYLNTLLKDWKAKGQMGGVPKAAPLNFKEARILLVDKADSRETRFLIGGKGVPVGHPDYVGIQVVNTVLGGRFTSWLNTALRIKSGLSYGARSHFRQDASSGTFHISSFTKTSTSVKAIDMALGVLDSLHKHGIDSKTLTSARNYVKGQFPPRYETSGKLAAFLADMFIYGTDESLINDFQGKVDGVTEAKAKEIIAKYFPKDKLQFVLVGKGDEIREEVKKYGKFSEKKISDPGF